MATEYIRPDGDQFVQWENVFPAAPPTHYDKIDEAAKDDDVTFVSTTVSWKEENFTLGNTVTLGAGDTINSIKVVSYAKTNVGSENIRQHIVTGGTHYYGAQVAVGTTYTKVEDTWVDNPNTTNPWTKAEIDALNAGFFSRGVSTELFVTQLYIEIDYTPAVAPPSGAGVGSGGSFMLGAAMFEFLRMKKEKRRRRLIAIMVKTMAKRKTMKGRASVYLRYQDKIRQLD